MFLDVWFQWELSGNFSSLPIASRLTFSYWYDKKSSWSNTCCLGTRVFLSVLYASVPNFPLSSGFWFHIKTIDLLLVPCHLLQILSRTLHAWFCAICFPPLRRNWHKFDLWQNLPFLFYVVAVIRRAPHEFKIACLEVSTPRLTVLSRVSWYEWMDKVDIIFFRWDFN